MGATHLETQITGLLIGTTREEWRPSCSFYDTIVPIFGGLSPSRGPGRAAKSICSPPALAVTIHGAGHLPYRNRIGDLL